MKKLIKLTVNDREHEIAVEPNLTLTNLIRYELGLTGTKKGCETGDCGACTVLLDGARVVVVCHVVREIRDVSVGPV